MFIRCCGYAGIFSYSSWNGVFPFRWRKIIYLTSWQSQCIHFSNDAFNRHNTISHWKEISGSIGVLQNFNAYNENIDTFQGVSGIEGKILILRQWLVANGLASTINTAIPDYDEAQGASNRYDYQHGLNPRNYPGVILTSPCRNSRREPGPRCP